MHITCPRCRKSTQFPDGLTVGTPIQCSHCGYSAPYAPASAPKSISHQSSSGAGCGVSVLITVVVLVSLAIGGLGLLLPWPIVGLAAVVLLVSLAVLAGKIAARRPWRKLLGSTGVVAALLLGGGGGGGVFMEYEEEQDRLAREREILRRDEARIRAILASRSQPNPCLAGQELRDWRESDGAIERWRQEPHLTLDRTLDELQQRCCEKRVDDVHEGIRNLNANGSGDENLRHESLGALAATVAMAEERFSALGKCEGSNLLGPLNGAVLIEAAIAQEHPEAWRAFRRVQDLQEENPQLQEMLFSVERRHEMAESCVSGGLTQADRHHARREHRQAEAAYRDVLACADAGGSISSHQRSRVERRLSEMERTRRRAELRESRARAAASRRAARARHRDSQRTARSCISACQRRGGNVWDCAGECANRHPDVAAEGISGW